MLKELLITNLALIEKLQVSFENGLTVLTGETGAGKSIILQAIHLLGGGKAAATWVRSGAEQASVEALFEVAPGRDHFRRILAEMGFEADEELVVKRVISAKGSSRYFINGSLATAKVVGQLVENMLSVASQNDHQQLLQPRSHLDFIDAVGDLWPKRQELAKLYDGWKELRQKYHDLHALEKDKEQRRDFLSFQAKEIEEAGLVAGEDESLAQERDRLRSSDDLIRLGQKSYQQLGEALNDHLAKVRKDLTTMAGFDPSLDGLAEEVAGHCFQLEDHLATLRSYLETIPNDPSRLDVITARIDLLQKLKRKYGNDLDEVIAFGAQARQELEQIEALDERLAELAKGLVRAEGGLVAAADALSKARQEVAGQLAERIGRELKSLCFEQAGFEINFGVQERDLAQMGRHGWDRPEFIFSANPGEALKPLVKVASGGELSRLMLALKCLLAERDQVETVIFDEIDAGISGKAAEAVARKIKELSGHHQVFCITHLPQIASFADEHFLVEKGVVDERTRTNISRLAPELRTSELARMLDGDSFTEQTLAYARDLIARSH
ncbi:MAG: DNA repair protein RecN [Desulfobulbaceae bacterium]|nr:DNA repair protein RecN [Desulfobulbaceae bacterium]